jgi:hypothetical protein
MPLPDPDYFIESIPNEFHGTRERPRRRWAWRVWLAPVAPLILGAAGAGVCYAAGGTSLGLFLGGLFWAAVLSGPLVAGEDSWLGKVLAGLGLACGIAAVWLYGATKIDLPLGALLASCAALAAMVFALGGLAALLRRLRRGGVGAGAIVTVLALAWLLWPIWLSAALYGPRGERVAAVVVPAHPVFAVNAVLRERLGYWVEQATAYHYTSLSDDVSYSLPDGVGPCVVLHAGIGVACAVACLLLRRRAPGSKQASP